VNHFVKGLLSCLIATSASVAAADIRGNGGDVVVCKDDTGAITSIELLDFYEGRHRYNLTTQLNEGTTYQEKLQILMQRIAKVDRHFATSLSAVINTFEANTLFWPGIQLVDIPDSGHIATPHGCEIVQIAVQKEPEFPDEKTFTISKDLWDHPTLDERSKAGLILHEVIYQRALNRGHTDSINTRYLTSFLTSTKFVPEAVGQYIDIQRRTFFRAPEVVGFKGLWFYNEFNTDLQFHDNSWLKEGRLIGSTSWTLKSGERLTFKQDQQATRLKFHRNGSLEAANNVEPAEIAIENGVIMTNGYLEFDDQERLIEANVGRGPNDSITLATSPAIIVNGTVTLFEGKYPTGGNMVNTQTVTVCGEPLSVSQYSSIEFDHTLTFPIFIGGVDGPALFCFRNKDTGLLEKKQTTGDTLRFGIDGQVLSYRGDSEFSLQNKTVALTSYIKFYPSGAVSEGTLTRRAQLTDDQGVSRVYQEGTRLLFNEDGFVTR
jgi:hypothetical protein